ncbi:alkaline shock response membrane anchor protein AmaP [Crassaminicella indica]|uniref:Alkaline shock response membrane anchor protein AmaP n=1 Tax=Crassaminicella indica TaxID=2855394 RepID=A0ABX8RGD9_9CLOT|nr:alkaline shock response membrane anchor protein AmaP [Crassaminicella indica]QXM06021.1 alkaline shock response membrane anchor protein AmaP [Crassaminicella indica]
MKLIDRIFLALYSLGTAILSLIIIVAHFNKEVYHEISFALIKYQTKLEYIIIPAIFFIVSIRFLFSRTKKRNLKSNAVIKHTPYGEVKITMETIENMAYKCARAIHGLTDIKPSAHYNNDHISIHIKALVLSDVNIPETAMTIQKKVKEHIEETTGITVQEVKVIINDIASQSKKRVQ